MNGIQIQHNETFMKNLLSQVGIVELQLPEGKHTIKSAPVNALPFEHEN